MAGIKIKKQASRDALKQEGIFDLNQRGFKIFMGLRFCRNLLFSRRQCGCDACEPLRIGKGDLVVLPAGMKCTLDFRQTILL